MMVELYVIAGEAFPATVLVSTLQLSCTNRKTSRYVRWLITPIAGIEAKERTKTAAAATSNKGSDLLGCMIYKQRSAGFLTKVLKHIPCHPLWLLWLPARGVILNSRFPNLSSTSLIASGLNFAKFSNLFLIFSSCSGVRSLFLLALFLFSLALFLFLLVLAFDVDDDPVALTSCFARLPTGAAGAAAGAVVRRACFAAGAVTGVAALFLPRGRFLRFSAAFALSAALFARLLVAIVRRCTLYFGFFRGSLADWP